MAAATERRPARDPFADRRSDRPLSVSKNWAGEARREAEEAIDGIETLRSRTATITGESESLNEEMEAIEEIVEPSRGSPSRRTCWR
ncbi:MAG: hypothetical protein ABEH78_03635 [Haloferacaceae archaeon]